MTDMIDMQKALVKKETEKSLGYSAELVCPTTDAVKKVLVWIPKSMIDKGHAPKWKLIKALEQAKAYAGIRSDRRMMGEIFGTAAVCVTV
jgi:hypothetical protein